MPRSWVTTQLENVADIILGQSPPSSTYNVDGKGMPFYQGKLEFGKTYPTPQKWCTAPAKIAEKDDVLISVRAPVGPTNMCPEKSCIGRGLAAIRALDRIQPFYLLYLMRNYEQQLSGQGTGTTFNAITGSQLRNFSIPLPPLSEQHRIVAKIEELFTRLDAGIEALKKIQLQLKRYRQSVLKSAFNGELTAEWRRAHRAELEPASVLLDKIKQERKKSGRYKELPPLDTTDLPELPEGWVWARLAEVGELKGGITVDSKRVLANGREVAYLRVANVQRGFLDLSEIKYINADEKDISELVLKPGDILFTEGGDRDKLGRGWIWQGEINECIHQNHIFRARLYNDSISNKFISWFANERGRDYFQRTGKQTTNLASVNLTQLSVFSIALPSTAEQHQIVAEVERYFSSADEIEKAIERSLTHSTRLRQSILKRAFEGGLVPQNPDDEPAEKLLERIKARRTRQYARQGGLL